MLLQDSAWKMTAICAENNCRAVAVFEPPKKAALKRRRLTCLKCSVFAISQRYAEESIMPYTQC